MGNKLVGSYHGCLSVYAVGSNGISDRSRAVHDTKA